MEGIILQTEKECVDLISQIDSVFSFLFQGVTETYTHYIKHLTKGTYLVFIDKDKISYLAAAFPDEFESLPYKLSDITAVEKIDYIKELDLF